VPVDVRDLAAFTLNQVEQRAVGAWNVAPPIGRETDGGMLAACREAVGSDATISWVEGQWLLDHEVRQWTELPLWRTGVGRWAMDATRSEAAGLVCRLLSETVADTWGWVRSWLRQAAEKVCRY